jgi:predicted dehydrogenase
MWGSRLAGAVGRVPGIALETCFARSPEQREEFAAAHGCRPAKSLDEILADPAVSGVLVATPHSTHEEIAVAAAGAGKHVFVEKPLTLDTAAAKRIIEACDRVGVVLQVGHDRRRQPGISWLKSLVDTGDLGEIAQAEANLSRGGGLQMAPDSWRADPAERPGGSMTALGVHMVDTLHHLLGPTSRVSAYSRTLIGASALDEVTGVLIEFASGALGYLGTSYVVPKVSRVAVFGTEAMAWSEDEGSKCYLQKKEDPDRIPVEVGTLDTVDDEIAEFRESMLGNAVPTTGGPEGLEVVAVLQAVLASVERGASVEVDEFR